jgi:hypothetical protein
MAATPEKKVKDAVRAILAKHGVYHVFVPANGYGRSGVPDILCCAHGMFLAVECKAGGNTPTKLQLRELEDIRLSGGYAVVVNEHNLDGFDSFLGSIIRRAKVWQEHQSTGLAI